MKSIGRNARIITAGDCRPTASTTAPIVAARLYAGAVEATPITTLDIRPSAPPFSPLSPPDSSTTSTGGVVGTLGDMLPPVGRPAAGRQPLRAWADSDGPRLLPRYEPAGT